MEMSGETGAHERKIYNHTVKLLRDWSIGEGIAYFLIEFAATLLLAAGYGTLMALFPGAGVPIVIRSLGFVFIFAALVSIFGAWTGAYMNPMISLVATVMFLFFGDYKSGSAIVWILELLKMLIFWVAQAGAMFAGFALISLWTVSGVTTTNCLVTPVITCAALPTVGTSFVAAHWMEAIGALFFCLAYGAAQRHRDGYKHSFIGAAFVACTYAFLHVIFGLGTGTPFNIWLWLVPAIYVNNFTNASVYTWPHVVACVVAFVLMVAWSWFTRWNKRKTSGETMITDSVWNYWNNHRSR